MRGRPRRLRRNRAAGPGRCRVRSPSVAAAGGAVVARAHPARRPPRPLEPASRASSPVGSRADSSPTRSRASAWLGVAAYRVSDFRVRGLPPLPGVASFLQLEVRAPVTWQGRPGLWLFQLETGKQLVAEVLKRTHRLPACGARLSLQAGAAGSLRFEARRDGHGFAVDYARSGQPFAAVPGTLDHFLTERYALYTGDGGRLYGIELHHLPWRLSRPSAGFEPATLTPPPLAGRAAPRSTRPRRMCSCGRWRSSERAAAHRARLGRRGRRARRR